MNRRGFFGKLLALAFGDSVAKPIVSGTLCSGVLSKVHICEYAQSASVLLDDARTEAMARTLNPDYVVPCYVDALASQKTETFGAVRCS